MPSKNMTSLNNFRHRVTLTHGQTEADDDTPNIVLRRTGVRNVAASITPIKGSFFLNGFALQENRNVASHYVVIRYNRDVDITGFAWLFEDRPSGKRWYKVLEVQEMGERERFWQMCCRLQQKSDVASEPSKPKEDDGVLQLPSDVRL